MTVRRLRAQLMLSKAAEAMDAMPWSQVCLAGLLGVHKRARMPRKARSPRTWWVSGGFTEEKCYAEFFGTNQQELEPGTSFA